MKLHWESLRQKGHAIANTTREIARREPGTEHRREYAVDRTAPRTVDKGDVQQETEHRGGS